MKSFGAVRKPCPDVVKPPVGEACAWCSEPIAEGDAGFMLPLVTESGAVDKPYHENCFLRQIVGSVGHLRGVCSCNGGSEEDPPEMTARQAANAAVEYYLELQKPRVNVDDPAFSPTIKHYPMSADPRNRKPEEEDHGT